MRGSSPWEDHDIPILNVVIGMLWLARIDNWVHDAVPQVEVGEFGEGLVDCLLRRALVPVWSWVHTKNYIKGHDLIFLG